MVLNEHFYTTNMTGAAFREDNDELKNTFPPLTDKRVAMGDVFTSCNWVLRDG
jgi:ATP-dependent DNA helicase 2 subunit 1